MQASALYFQNQAYDDQELSAVFTPRTGHIDFELHELPRDEEEPSQGSTEPLAIIPQSEHNTDSFFATSPVTGYDSAPADISLSPAAMFLNSFSPLAAPQALPDDEGESVSGYVLGPIIGRGGFSTIRRASSAQGGVVAVKIVRRADLDKQEDPERARVQLQHEAAVWSSLSHEHILPLFSSCHTSYADFFITLYCPAGSLFDILKRDGRPALPQDEAGRMYRQVVKGLRYMHEVAGYVHGDMKLENVMVDDMGVCRIGDFGMAKKIGEGESDDEERSSRASIKRHATVRQKRSRSRHPMHHILPSHPSLLHHQSGPRHRNSSPFPNTASPSPSQVFQPGSLPYASPELLMPSSAKAPYHAHPAQDIWALGVMLYVMLTGRMPFADSFEPRLQMKILNGAFTMPSDIGRGAEQVLQGSLEHSVQQRWTIAMVDEVAWGIGWGTVGDATPPPSQPTRATRSRSRAKPQTVPENAVLDHETDSTSQRSTSLSSRSRSRHSRPRHKAFHPYNLTIENNNNECDSPIARTSSSSADSECLSPMDRLEIRTPSTSPERRQRRIRAVSPSPNRSLLEHVSPVDVIMHDSDRGRKASPIVRSRLLSATDNPLSPVSALDTDTLSPPTSYMYDTLLPDRASSSSSASPRPSRRTRSQANRSLDRQRKARDTSLPSRHDLQDFPPSNGVRGFMTPARRGDGLNSASRLVSPRSCSVDSPRLSRVGMST